jgi:hypothetical protein
VPFLEAARHSEQVLGIQAYLPRFLFLAAVALKAALDRGIGNAELARTIIGPELHLRPMTVIQQHGGLLVKVFLSSEASVRCA